MAFRIDGVKIEYIAGKPTTKNARLIQGLLGVGHVGLLAVKQLISSLGAERLADVYSPDFLYPGSNIPGVVYGDDGIVDIGKDELYYDKKNDLFVLTGLYQGVNSNGYYDFANSILDLCDEYGIKEIYTLGGFGIGQPVAEPNVKAVLADKNTARLIKGRGVSLDVTTSSEGSLGVTGLAGLLVPMAVKNGISAACLLGETHGSYPDPKSAKASLLKLTEILGISVTTPELDDQIEKMETEIAKMEEEAMKMQESYGQMQPGGGKTEGGPEDLPYIG